MNNGDQVTNLNAGPRRHPLAMALWANAALLILILATMWSRSGKPDFMSAAMAQNQPNIAGGGGVFVMPGQTAQNQWGAYLLDIDSQTLCVYQYSPGEKKFRLSAARSYKYDRKLENFNTDMPTPREVKALVEKQQADPMK